MSTFDIVTVIAIILFARLGIRLNGLHKKYKEEKNNQDEGPTSSNQI